MKITALNYTQHLITAQTNYTCSYFGDRIEGASGDKIERYLKSAKLTPRMLWDKTVENIVYSKNGCIIFDDTVIDHNRSSQIEIARKQYSGNAHKVIKGIGLVGCVYYNPDLDQTWLIDYRLYDPDTDGMKKTQHALEIYNNIVFEKQVKSGELTFQFVLFDAAYATKELLAQIDNTSNKYLCNMRSSRNCWEHGVDYSSTNKKLNNKPVSFKNLDFGEDKDLKDHPGKIVRLKGFPTSKLVKLFKIIVSTDRTDYIITNDMTIDDQNVIKSVNGMRWNIESFHKEIKQITGIESCQCRKNRSQRNHINLALRAWIYIKQQAVKLKATVYKLKQNQLDEYYISTMNNPILKFEW